MNKITKYNQYFIGIIVFILPFLEFIKNNISEIDIILVKSFYFLFITLLFFLILFSISINRFIKKLNFSEVFIISSLSYWLIFKHNLININLKRLFEQFNSFLTVYSAEIGILIILILIFFIYFLIKRKNLFFLRFISIFIILSFLINLIDIYNGTKADNLKKNFSKEIIFKDNLNSKKNNIYFFILDAMQPIEDFENYYNINLGDFNKFIKNYEYEYKKDTTNLYDNTTHGLSAIFYLQDIFDKDNKLKQQTNILYPTLLRKENQSILINNLDYLEYDFKWIGNYFAYCPKFNLKYCLNEKNNSYFDTYLYINFFRQTPLIQLITNVAHMVNYDFNKNFFYRLNDGLGRLRNHLESNDDISKKNPTFFFVHHMSPHWPYITSNDCSYNYYPGKKNYEGYENSYLCVLKKIKETIIFLNKNDPDATIIFQSDHNWPMSQNKKEKKRIFNLYKIDETCKKQNEINLNNVNMLRLVFACMTGNDPNYIKYNLN